MDYHYLITDFAVSMVYGYTIFGNIFRYLKNQPIVEKELQTITNASAFIFTKEQQVWHPPTYMNTQYVSVPIGGGMEISDEILGSIIIGGKKESTGCTAYYVNRIIQEGLNLDSDYISNRRELYHFLKKHRLSPSISIGRVPFHVLFTKNIPIVYHNQQIAGVQRKAVINTIHLQNRLPLTLTLFTITSLFLVADWAISPGVGRSPHMYPVYHYKRYF
jgi:hypothetical protein